MGTIVAKCKNKSLQYLPGFQKPVLNFADHFTRLKIWSILGKVSDGSMTHVCHNKGNRNETLNTLLI